MLWSKKENKKGLPELPPIKSPFNNELNAPKNFPEAMEHDEHEESDENYDSIEKHSLPSFPDSPIKKGFSQTAIKDAISDGDTPNPESVVGDTNSEKNFKTIEIENTPMIKSDTYIPSQKSSRNDKMDIAPIMKSSSLKLGPPPAPMPSEREDVPMRRPMTAMPQDQRRDSSIFVKIDKFNSARKALATTQEQLEHIDSLLNKIREIKLREEQELSSWEKEMMTIKSRIQAVTEDVFEKVE